VTAVVRAAGGVIRRDGRVLLVHRPKYDDWTLPKGKADPGESDAECALRELEEETGYVCVLGRDLGTSEYLDARGRPKVVRWFAATPVHGSFQPTDEVDQIEWLTPAEAETRLSYERDRDVLARTELRQLLPD
jgi:8-oxo-dGTP diphosphatase